MMSARSSRLPMASYVARALVGRDIVVSLYVYPFRLATSNAAASFQLPVASRRLSKAEVVVSESRARSAGEPGRCTRGAGAATLAFGIASLASKYREAYKNAF